MNLREIYVRERLRQGQAGQMGQAGDEPALYFLDEVTALRGRTPEELREIHTAKLDRLTFDELVEDIVND